MSIFEFDDQQGVRTRGTLRAPGATPGDVLTVGTSRGTVTPSPGGGSQPYVRKTITFADFRAAAPGPVDALAIPEGEVLISLGLQIPLSFDGTGTNGGLTFTTGGGAVVPCPAFDLSSDTTTSGGALFGLGVAQGTPGDAPGLPITGGAGGSTLSVGMTNGVPEDGSQGTLVLIAEIATPTAP